MSRARCLLAALPILTLTCAATAQTLEAQRQAFMQVYPKAELGDWKPVEVVQDLLQTYVLWPDLEAAWLRSHLDEEQKVRAFLARYGTLKPARDIRYRHALRLARLDRTDEFLDLYEQYYSTLGEPVLDCLAARADAKRGDTEAAIIKGRRLWLVGSSQVKQCDPLFTWMRKHGALGEGLMRERYALAVDNREFLLARYVARSLGEDELAEANRWLRAQGDPDSFLSRADIGRRDETYRTQLGYAASRLAIGNPLAAWRHWSRLRKDMDFTRELERSVARQVALWAARRDIGEADRLLQTLDPEAIDDEVRRWQIRNALRRQDWLAVLHLVDSLEPQERDREEWRYWKAIALDKTGQPAESMLTLSSLARERSYYGFLAADELGIDYAIETVRIEADESAIARLAGDPALVRARELFLTGLDGRGRSEWNEAVRGLSQHDKAQAALLAERWDWPSRAIASAAQAGQMDSLDLRYPLPHLDAFRESAAAAGIRESWAYGVARSESIFMRDVRSSAGAIGLMQLMPATGRSTAREIRLPYSGLNTLTDPASNIRLGATYLGKMHDRFNQHPAVATAAYNAGPNRVSQWLPDSAAIDARIWVETIPYNETRNYVRSVLTSDVIFAWRLTGKVPRLSDQLPEIRPPQLPQSASGQ